MVESGGGTHDADASGAGIDARYGDGTYLSRNPTWHSEDSPWKAARIAEILRAHRLTPRVVAEVGCGSGAILPELARQMPTTRFVGFDLSSDAASLWAQRQSDRIEFRQADFGAVEEHFDVLLCIDVFEHVENYYEFLERIRGKADHTVFHIPLDISVLNIVMGGFMGARESVGHLHYFTPETALATLTDTGYEIVDSRYTFLHRTDPGASPQARLLRGARRALYARSPLWQQRLLGGSSLMVLAR